MTNVWVIITKRQSVRRINDALGRFYSTLVYVYLSVTLGKDCHIHAVMLGKDRHTHTVMNVTFTYAFMHARIDTETEETALERRRRLARESATEYFRLVQGEGFCCKQPLMNTIVITKMGVILM